MTDHTDKIVDALIKDPAREKPQFIANPNMDKLIAAVLRLAMENAVLRDRIVRQENLLKDKGVLSSQDYDDYQPDKQSLQKSQADSFELIRALAKDLG